MIKLSDELVQGLAIGDAAARVEWERVSTAAALAEDDLIMRMAGIKQPSVKDRFHELLAQHPELTRPQAYMQAVMEISEPIIEAALEERARRGVKEAMAMDDGLGGCLVPSGVTVEIATRLGMPRLRDMLKWDVRVRAAIRDKPRWWQWLFHNYSTNKIASFLVWRWPKFREVVTAYDDCVKAHQEEKERRVQKAYEFLKEWRKGHNNDHQASMD